MKKLIVRIFFSLCVGLLVLFTACDGNQQGAQTQKETENDFDQEIGRYGYNESRALELIANYNNHHTLSKVELNEGAEICIAMMYNMIKELDDSDDVETTFANFSNKYKGGQLIPIILENSDQLDDHLLEQLQEADLAMSTELGIEY